MIFEPIVPQSLVGLVLPTLLGYREIKGHDMDTHIISDMKIRLQQDIEAGTGTILPRHTVAQIIKCFDEQAKRIKKLEEAIRDILPYAMDADEIHKIKDQALKGSK